MLLAFTALLVPVPAQAAKTPKTLTVVVDCRKGDSVASALLEEAEELIVEVRGLCREDVKVLRGSVTLRGSDPAVDGIRGVARAPASPSLSATTATLEVRGHGVVVERLRLTGGAQYGLLVVGSQSTEVRHCRLVDNGELGASFTGGSAALVSDTSFSGNGAGGVRVNRSSTVNFKDCVIGDNPSPRAGIAVEALNGGRAFLEESRLQGAVGLSVMNGAMGALSDSSLEGGTLGLSVKGLGHADLSNVALRGAISASARSLVVLRGVNQIANPRRNSLTSDSTLQLANAPPPGADAGDAATVGTRLLGPTEVRQFSRLIFQGGALHTGDLTCASGADAFCGDPEQVAGSLQGCASCKARPPR